MHISVTRGATRFVCLGFLALALSACNTSNAVTAIEPPAATPAQQPVTATGTIPDYCPNVTLREGTAILRKGEGDAVRYVASVTGTTRSCRVRGDELFMEVAIAGRVVPGPTAVTETALLPIRVAVVNGGAVAYSQLGQQGVNISPNSGPVDFSYVDRNVRLPVPQGRTLTVYAGFDEGAPAARRVAARPAN